MNRKREKLRRKIIMKGKERSRRRWTFPYCIKTYHATQLYRIVQANPTASGDPCSLSQGLNNASSVANPTVPIEMLNVAFKPAIYAWRTPSRWSGKASRMLVAPVATTTIGLRSGAVVASFLIIVLTKADSAAETQNAPPRVWNTGDEIC